MVKFNSLNKVSCSRFPGGFGLIHFSFLQEAFKLKEQMSLTANMVAAAGVDLTAKICEEVDGLTSWIEFFAEVFDKCRVYDL